MYRISSCARQGIEPENIKGDYPYFDLDRPYYGEQELLHHYPNLYDFRRAAAFREPPPVFAPYNRPLVPPKDRPSYMKGKDYRVTSDWLSKWGDKRILLYRCQNVKEFPRKTPSEPRDTKTHSSTYKYC
ncbi:uncharacterized protein LOC106011354 [Aplysia californica]|uniref:Uncharacterized protein LOC106011354 n=1 Tax=Aplysia californica TaxID=6500 RepID=A0ABM0ZWT8_APLCA|nr:uncharacterized protein LOC106011354 [Aplysia californica]